jgi:hypothetical protein
MNSNNNKTPAKKVHAMEKGKNFSFILKVINKEIKKRSNLF